MSKCKRVLKPVTAAAQLSREAKLASDVIAAVAAYVRAGNPPNLKDADDVERIVAAAASTLRRELKGEKGGFLFDLEERGGD